MTGRIQDRVAVVTGGCSGIGLATVQRFVEEGAKVVIGDIDDQRGHELVGQLGGADIATYVHVDVTSKDEVDALFQTAKDTLRRGRHRLQQRRDQPAGGRLDPRHRPRGLAEGAGGQPHERLPVLQGRAPPHARAGPGVDHQHRLVRGGDGRGDVPDLLLGVQGRRAVDDPRARRPVRPRRESASTPSAPVRSTRRCSRSSSPRTPSGPPAGWCTCRWGGSASPRRWPRRCCSWPPTTRRS